MSERKPLRDFAAQRLFVEDRLSKGRRITLQKSQANYLLNVLRKRLGDEILVFNGLDGEWLCEISFVKRSQCELLVGAQTRVQEAAPDIDYLFAPLKRARLDYMVQKAAEMGAARLQPVITERTNVARVNLDRMRANAIEAAEQCGILHIPEVLEPSTFDAAIQGWDETRRLIFCDEAASIASPLDALQAISPGPLAVLIGPEGGFSPGEREKLLEKPYVTVISLGPRVLRADTAAVAVLALVNAVLGDWK